MTTKSASPEKFGLVALPELKLSSGKILGPVIQAYSINGTPLADGSNVVVVCHALTGSHHIVGPNVAGLPPAWWETIVGPGKAIDTNRLCVVSFCNLASPYGSTSPMSVNPKTGKPWAMAFPAVTVRDMAHAQRAALAYLNIKKAAAVVGSSMGGMIAMEWAIEYPDIVDRCIVIAAPARLYPQAIAYNEVQRQAIFADPDWEDGNYYGGAGGTGAGPVKGLANARMLAMITYRSEQAFAGRWMRSVAKGDPHAGDGQFEVESYLHHHGEAIIKRFDANCYVYLTKAMDLHDIGHQRDGIDTAFAPFAGKDLLAVGISSDLLFPHWQVEEVAQKAAACGVRAVYEEIVSDNGHDSFLIDFDELDGILRDFILSSGLLS